MRAEPRAEFYAQMDAANVDLKAFTEDFYHKLCLAELAPVLETLVWLKRETAVWLEVTTLLIPGYNDSEREIGELCQWFGEQLGPAVPLHFTAFHPDFKLRDVPPTPWNTLRRARRQARELGLRHVFTGNVQDTEGQSTYCPSCGQLLIERDRYELGEWNLDAQGRCRSCHTPLAGHFDARPGDWGGRRQLVRVAP
jgi:pyruvate formate lyase activating enzyme